MRDSPNLDLLRTFAVALVVVSHIGLNLGWSGPTFDIEVMGRVGVAMFFVHTSLVLMLSMDRTGESAAPFLIRRAFRIYPLAIAVVVLMAVARWRRDVPMEFGMLASNLLLVQNITGHKSEPPPLWSLPYEMQMYLLLPAIYAATRMRWTLGRMLAVWSGSAAIVLLSPAWAEVVVRYVPCFLPGIMAFVLLRRGGGTLPSWALFALAVVGALALPIVVAAGVPETPLLWAMSLALGLVIPTVRELTSAPLARVAKIVATYSYGLYLTHLLAIGMAFVSLAFLPAVVQWLMFLLLLGSLPILAYHWIEAPGMRLGATLAAQWKKPPTRRSGAGASAG